jgi:hypothetical protein
MPAKVTPAIERFFPFHKIMSNAKLWEVAAGTEIRTVTVHVLSPRSADLPVGRFVERGVQPCLQKYFGFRTPQITSRTLAIPSHTEGRFAIVTDVGTGCGGRGSVLRAMGLQGGFFESVSDQRAGGREMLQRTAKSCGPDAPTLASSLVEGKSARPGADKPDIREMTVAKEPGHRREHDISR